MAPPAEAPALLPVSAGTRSVASAFFGDDTDSQPLWFKKDAFMEPNFDSEAYIADMGRLVTLDTLKAELRSHFAALKNELVELINRDYTDFVNLSTKLVDIDGAMMRMRTPLQELRAKLGSVRDSVAVALSLLQDALKRRAEASGSREILELLLDTSHVVSKIEKLLTELQNMPEDGGHISSDEAHSIKPTNNGAFGESIEHCVSLEESRSRLLERIASEMNRLKFYVARAQDLPFIQSMDKRIQNADTALDASLQRCFQIGLQRRDKRVVYHSLRAYAAIDNTAGAEDVFRRTGVAPFVQQVIPPSPPKDLVGGTGDRLEEVFQEIQKHVQAECSFLLEIAASANSGLHVFDFLSNSILKEVHSAIQKGKPGAFSPGKPAEFLANYKSSLKFLVFLEGYCQSQIAVVGFRSQAAYLDFMKQWNLGVYFTLRLQEIAGSLESALATSVISPIEVGRTLPKDGDLGPGFILQISATLWECLQRCWEDDVHILSASDKFLKLTSQLLSRFSTWLSTGLAARKAGNASNYAGGEWALIAAADDFILIRHDVELIVNLLRTSYVGSVSKCLTLYSTELLLLVQNSILQSAQMLVDVVPALTDVLIEALAEKCVEVLRQLKGITATYRMTNKPLPTRHSPYVSGVLQPLKAFLDGERASYLKANTRAEFISAVIEKVTARYDELARELVTVARRTESSLQRLRQGARQRVGAGADTTDSNISDTDKICAQLFLDVQEYGRWLASFGVNAKDVTSYLSLWQCVAPQEQQ
ncbi:hypothetical protein O6H91_05G073700 [Diphasiastrum complanatum]|uniref:Uncharacterized protein n=1 Tax=Diphasiastrum complanatum TaxID=34168 RepID=A0ACC2DPF1_DIPCM|nr:hypothetical protein O6H91_05G073700 [Diphasiastrum complanatum]